MFIVILTRFCPSKQSLSPVNMEDTVYLTDHCVSCTLCDTLYCQVFYFESSCRGQNSLIYILVCSSVFWDLVKKVVLMFTFTSVCRRLTLLRKLVVPDSFIPKVMVYSST